MKRKKRFSGIVIPAVTPLTAALSLDHAAVEKMFDHFGRHKASAFVLGTTGEAASLPVKIKKDLLQTAGKLKRPGDVLYAGISSNAFSESVELANESFNAGVDVVVATLPAYYQLTETAMLRYFEQLADAVDGPLMIYNIPATTHMSIPPSLIDQLSHHEKIVGIKDSERDEERLAKSLQLWSGREDFSYFLGWAARSADAIAGGADGLVPSTGNLHPALYGNLLEAARRYDKGTALGLQGLSDQLGNLYQKGRTLGESLWALKVLMKAIGLCESHVMPPLYAQSCEDEKNLQALLQWMIKNDEINF